MRDGWAETSLGEVADVLSGFAFKSELFSEKQGIPLIRIRDLQKQTWTEVGYLGDFDERYVVNKGDFLIGMDGEFRCYEWLGGKALLNQRVCRIQDFASTQIIPRFVYFLVNNYLEEIEKSTSYTTVKHISIKQVKGISFPLPPLTEQKRIVDVVTSVDTYIDALKQQVDIARRARNAVLHELLSADGKGWEEITLGDLTSTTRPICYGVLKPGPFVDGGVPLVRITDMDRSLLGPEGMHRISPELDDEFRRSRLRGNEVLLSIQGTVGRVARCAPELVGANISRTIAVIDCDKRMMNEFLAIYLESLASNNSFNSSGSTRDSLNISEIRLITISVPPLVEQKRIVEIVSSMDDVIQVTEQTLINAKSLRSGLLSDLLSGEHEIPASYDVFVGAA